MDSVFEEKHDEKEEGELSEWETTDKKTKYIKNAHGQTKVKVSAPLTIQKKALNDESYFYKVIDYIESTPIDDILKLARGPGKLIAAFTKQTGESYSLPYYLDLDLFPSFEWHFKQQADDENNPKHSVERTVH
eukprot:scaffold45093_cov53-Cyclotella_meneghiniana.AAC.1